MRHELKAIKDEIRTISNASSAESWVGFFWRKSVDSYRYFVPRQSSASSNQDRESWASFLSRKSCDSYRYFLPKNWSHWACLLNGYYSFYCKVCFILIFYINKVKHTFWAYNQCEIVSKKWCEISFAKKLSIYKIKTLFYYNIISASNNFFLIFASLEYVIHFTLLTYNFFKIGFCFKRRAF